MTQVIKTIFTADIQKNLYPNNEFYKNSKADTGIIDTAKTIEIPQSGAAATGGKNPSSFPLSITTRADDKQTYDADLYYTDPIHIEDNDIAVLSYDKRKDILEDHIAYLKNSYAKDVAYNWCPTLADNIIRTTGDAKATTLTGATGTRKSLTIEDFINADRILTRMETPGENRHVLLSADMYAQLLTAGISSFVGVDKLSSDLLARGVVGQILGFNIYKRSSVARYDNSATPVKRAVGAVNAATDNDVALFWHSSFVRRGEGKVKMYADIDKPEYLGSIYNAKVRGGSVIPRLDQAGVVALVQAAGA